MPTAAVNFKLRSSFCCGAAGCRQLKGYYSFSSVFRFSLVLHSFKLLVWFVRPGLSFRISCVEGSEKPGFFFKKAQPSGFWGFIGFFGQAGKIGKIIQKLSNLEP